MTGSMERLLAFMPEAVVVIDDGHRIIYFNRSAEQMFGYGAGEALGRPLEILIPPSARAQHRLHVAAFEASEEDASVMHNRREVSGFRSDGTIFSAEATIVKGDWQGQPATFTIVRDITERKLRQAALAASESKYRAILETSPEPILIADVDTGRLIEANAAAARLFGCSATDLLGIHQTELHPEDQRDRFRQTFRDHIENGRIVVPDAVIQKANGEIAPVEIYASPVLFNGEHRLVGYFRDMSRWVRQESHLRDALAQATSAIESKRMFLANMSHELRTPLNGIIGFSSLIAREAYGPHLHPNYREYGDIIHRSGEHLLAIVNDILDLSKIELGQYSLDDQIVDVREIVEAVRPMLSNLFDKAEISLEVDLDDAQQLLADRRAVKQMLINVLSNSLKFTRPGGRVRISTSTNIVGETVISIRDTGVGVAPDRLPTITTPFVSAANTYTKRNEGTGIGLSITKKLIELHGGRMEIESELGVGTNVHLIFPADRLGAKQTIRRTAESSQSS